MPVLVPDRSGLSGVLQTGLAAFIPDLGLAPMKSLDAHIQTAPYLIACRLSFSWLGPAFFQKTPAFSPCNSSNHIVEAPRSNELPENGIR